MEVPLVSTGPAPAPGAPAPDARADGSSFDEALAAADAELDVETAGSDSSLAVLAALLALTAPATVQTPVTAPDASAQSAAEVQGLNWALAPTAADPSAAAADRLATLTECATPPAPQAGTIDESAAGLSFAGALGAAETDAEPVAELAPQPPETQAEPAAPKLRLLRELDDTPIIYSNTPNPEPARLTEAHPTTIKIPESAVLVQVERALESLGDSTTTPNSVRLQLQPESLGRIELRVTHGEHGLRVTLTAENAATGQLLERRLDDLRQTLVASGVEVSGLSVSVGHGQADARSFFWQRPAFGLSAVPVRAFGDDYGSAAILVTAQNGAQRAALTGVDYRI
jgi:flagellar hook-length control protein FliK